MIFIFSKIYFTQWNIHGYSNYISSENGYTNTVKYEGKLEGKKVYSYGNELYIMTFSAKHEPFGEYLSHPWMNKKYVFNKFDLEKQKNGYKRYVNEDNNLWVFETKDRIIISKDKEFFDYCMAQIDRM